jgi:hypothetical protein
LNRGIIVRDFELNDVVEYTIGDLKGFGKIKGVAITEQVFIGKTYIIEDSGSNFPNLTYPYTHLACPSIYIKKYR